jgi:hypothetical protein
MNPTIPTTHTLNPPKFGGAPVAGVGPLTAKVDRAFSQWIAPNRTQEMLVEDLLGFGGLRTVMDLMRNRIFGGHTWDVASARERLMRESLSIVTDNVASGVVAYGMGHVLDKALGTFSNQFMSFNTLETFAHWLKQGAHSEQAFVAKLAHGLAPNNPTQAGAIAQVLAPLYQTSKAMPSKQNGTTPAVNTAAMAKAINSITQRNHYDVTFGPHTFALPTLLDDAHVFLQKARQPNVLTKQAMQATAPQWGPAAQQLLQRTLAVKHAKLLSLSVGFLLTFAVPYWIRSVTRRLDKQDTYPGERGLRPAGSALPNANGQTRFSATSPNQALLLDKPKVFSTFAANNTVAESTPNGVNTRAGRWFPFVTQSLNAGNPVPLALAALPLMFTVGLFDTVNRRFRNPFAPGFLRYLRNAYDFGKGFPFTTQQQMASMYAFLIASRLSSSRSGNEYRERLVDSFAGWGLWILGTPIIKRAVSRLLDRSHGTQLVKPNGTLRTRQEIVDLIKDGEKTFGRHVWVGALSTLATIVMLGLVEPYVAILWTKRNVQRQQSPTPFSAPSA